MEALLKFDIPDQHQDLLNCLQSRSMLYALRSFDEQLSIRRTLAKNGDEELLEQLDTIDWIQDLFRCCCEEQKIDIWH